MLFRCFVSYEKRPGPNAIKLIFVTDKDTNKLDRLSLKSLSSLVKKGKGAYQRG